MSKKSENLASSRKPSVDPEAVGNLILVTARAVERLTRLGVDKHVHDDMVAAIAAVENPETSDASE